MSLCDINQDSFRLLRVEFLREVSPSEREEEHEILSTFHVRFLSKKWWLDLSETGSSAPAKQIARTKSSSDNCTAILPKEVLQTLSESSS